MKIVRFILGMILVTGLLAGHTALAAGKALTFGVHPWPENIAVAHLWQQLLQDRGYRVKLLTAGKAPLWAGVAKGNIDLDFEAWLPSADSAYYQRFKNDVTLIGPWFERATLGLVVPDYVQVQSIPQLKDRASLFVRNGKPTIVGIGAGASLTALAGDTVKRYDLPFRLQTSSDSAMMAALASAYTNNKPIVVTLWAPHWAWAAYKLHYLKDPKGTFGKPDHIYIFAHRGFKAAHPRVAGWLSRFKLSGEQLAKLMNIVRKSSSPDQGIARWLKAHHAVTDAWFQAQ